MAKLFDSILEMDDLQSIDVAAANAISTELGRLLGTECAPTVYIYHDSVRCHISNIVSVKRSRIDKLGIDEKSNRLSLLSDIGAVFSGLLEGSSWKLSSISDSSRFWNGDEAESSGFVLIMLELDETLSLKLIPRKEAVGTDSVHQIENSDAEMIEDTFDDDNIYLKLRELRDLGYDLFSRFGLVCRDDFHRIAEETLLLGEVLIASDFGVFANAFTADFGVFSLNEGFSEPSEAVVLDILSLYQFCLFSELSGDSTDADVEDSEALGNSSEEISDAVPLVESALSRMYGGSRKEKLETTFDNRGLLRMGDFNTELDIQSWTRYAKLKGMKAADIALIVRKLKTGVKGSKFSSIDF